MELIKARYIGQNGSLGYKTNRVYWINLFYPDLFQQLIKYGFGTKIIVIVKGHPNCPYSLEGFINNWQLLMKRKKQ